MRAMSQWGCLWWDGVEPKRKTKMITGEVASTGMREF